MAELAPGARGAALASDAAVPGACALPPIGLVAETGCVLDDVLALGRGIAPAGSAVAAACQTAGRGRRGHLWQSPEGGLYLAVLLRPKVGMQYLNGLTTVCSLALLDAARVLGAVDVRSKWPDDVVSADGRKLGGVTVEAGYGEGGVFAVCGAMLNLRSDPGLVAAVRDTFDGTPHPLEPGSLAECAECAAAQDADGTDASVTPAVTDVTDAARVVREAILARVAAWEVDVAAGRGVAGPCAPVLDEYYDELWLMGGEVDALLPDGRPCAHGLFSGLDAWGHAIVLDGESGELALSPEQASIRPAATPAPAPTAASDPSSE